jgi:hypothetical protein
MKMILEMILSKLDTWLIVVLYTLKASGHGLAG